jgi:hypothetical protein
MSEEANEGPWLLDGQLVYRLTQDGWYKGKPTMVNSMTIKVTASVGSSIVEATELAAKIQAMLNAADIVP